MTTRLAPGAEGVEWRPLSEAGGMLPDPAPWRDVEDRKHRLIEMYKERQLDWLRIRKTMDPSPHKLPQGSLSPGELEQVIDLQATLATLEAEICREIRARIIACDWRMQGRRADPEAPMVPIEAHLLRYAKMPASMSVHHCELIIGNVRWFDVQVSGQERRTEAQLPSPNSEPALRLQPVAPKGVASEDAPVGDRQIKAAKRGRGFTEADEALARKLHSLVPGQYPNLSQAIDDHLDEIPTKSGGNLAQDRTAKRGRIYAVYRRIFGNSGQ
jgi:hypothetical protein